MSFFLANNTGMLSRKRSMDVFSQWTFATPISVPCAVVALVDSTIKTSVRTDQSGSHGASEEDTIKAKILFPPAVGIGIDDRFAMAGLTMRVTSVEPRYDIFGAFNHNEVMLEHLQ